MVFCTSKYPIKLCANQFKNFSHCPPSLSTVVIAHVWYIKILTWLRGFRIKITNFSRFLCLNSQKSNLSTNKTKPNNYRKMTRRPPSHRILIYGTWAIWTFEVLSSLGTKKSIYSQTRSRVPPKNTLMNLLLKSWIRC